MSGTARLRGQQRRPQPGLVIATLSQQEGQLQVPELRIGRVGATRLLEAGPGGRKVALVGQDAGQAPTRRRGQRTVRVLGHALEQGPAP